MTLKAFYVNGIFTTESRAIETAKKISNIIGFEAEAIYNGSIEFSSQILSHETIQKEKKKVVERLKQKIEAMPSQGVEHLAIFAHSQGADIIDQLFFRTPFKIPPGIKIFIVTLGGMVLIPQQNDEILVRNFVCGNDDIKLFQRIITYFKSSPGKTGEITKKELTKTGCDGHSIDAYLEDTTVQQALKEAAEALSKELSKDLQLVNFSEPLEEDSTEFKSTTLALNAADCCERQAAHFKEQEQNTTIHKNLDKKKTP